MDDHSHIAEQLHTVRDFIRWGASRFGEEALFFGHGTDNAWDESVALVLHGLYLPNDSGPQVLDARLTSAEKQRVLALLERRISKRIPAPYITGSAWFCGLEFMVDERVLIPRSPIAELIEAQFVPWLQKSPERILDLCCGSGCIGIACAYAFEYAQVDVSDISADALDVAQQNIHLHHMDGQVRALQSDLFQGLADERYDLIVCNPPYVDEVDFGSMPSEFHHEPSLALASGEDGLDFTRRLLAQAADHLNDGGHLVLEVGNSWPALEAAYPQLGFEWVEFERGGHGVCVLNREQLTIIGNN
ncbi:50S ribosomal protein L3 N(5)-glutamine methyltransferase [Porticoccus sp. W117]|uniref:50S ribosomal protein L3 N(5)-glutamine methyltransferase n=1 Tax=Porticoccus sp. W117 TaxID=3054777 RepID=UPI0025950C13|nr:50S ribosomal protein L3 N(5)-glutamine methyltransferase [Porticoccus sp. W117]MDM3872282.1 50S ribosomal protein L3 N(5)-glutamine methyltransferase [Porticoccus sp. W117]